MNFLFVALNLVKMKINWCAKQKLFGIDTCLIFLFIVINLYVISFINGVFWDDWVIHRRERGFYVNFFRSAGAFDLIGYVHYLFQSVGVWLYKIIIFIFTFISIIIFGQILNEIRLTESLKKTLLVCMIVFPLFESKYLSIHLFYVISISSFLLAYLLILKDKVYLAQPFFWISYINNSYILVALAAIFFYILIFNDKKKINGLFITTLIAVLFVINKYVFYVPNGSYEGYNKISFYLVGSTFVSFLSQFESLLNWIAVELVHSRPYRALTFFIMGYLISYFIISRCLGIVGKKLSTIDRKFFLLIVVISLAGLTPYFLVGKSPFFYFDFGSRHFSGSFIGLIGLIGYFTNFLAKLPYKIGKIFITLLFGLMVTSNLLINEDYRVDSLKSRAIIDALQKIDNLPNKLIIVQDDSGVPWASRRKGLSFYEWAGIFRANFGSYTNNWNYFVYDSVFWSGEGCYKASGLYRREFSSDISDRENNLATYINLKLDSELSHIPYAMNFIIDVKKNIEVCKLVCDECGFKIN